MKRASPALSLKPLPSALPARGEGCCTHGPGASTGIRPGAGRAAPCCPAQPFLHFCLSSASSLSWISACSPYALCPAMGTRRHLHFHVAVTGKGRPCQQPVSQRVAKRPVLHSETGRIAARNGLYCSAERAVLQRGTGCPALPYAHTGCRRQRPVAMALAAHCQALAGCGHSQSLLKHQPVADVAVAHALVLKHAGAAHGHLARLRIEREHG